MNKGSLIAVVLIAIVAVIILRKPKFIPPSANKQTQRSNGNNPVKNTNNKPNNTFTDNVADVNRHPKNIHYTKHAKCRMDCRHFTKQEVAEILEKGKINFDKSKDRAGKCPTYALEGETSDGQHARMVFSFCGKEEVDVVTVIDLDTDWDCNCY